MAVVPTVASIRRRERLTYPFPIRRPAVIDFAAYTPTQEDVPVTIAAGTRLRHYEILTPLGAGGLGEVYLAEAVTEPDHLATIKVLPL